MFSADWFGAHGNGTGRLVPAREHVFPLASFGTDGKDLLMLLIVGGPGPGTFDLLVDEVRIR